MPRVVISANAAADLHRVRVFLQEKNPTAAERAAKVILAALTTLTTDSLANRPYPPMANAREMVVRFGAYGYVVLYQFVPEVPLVTVLAVKHQRELGYRVP